ncbi:CapA family protein [Paenibacillus sp. NEAU-GSW1]|uniref:CapA family protein n=1 Tax=Paenibacillus sp. NEAU-GSW1 TaxID=2682486 RepID=UPI0020A6C9BE|nr:CapA family protein [Paenibacillus sp. NEAU-GSW1]
MAGVICILLAAVIYMKGDKPLSEWLRFDSNSVADTGTNGAIASEQKSEQSNDTDTNNGPSSDSAAGNAKPDEQPADEQEPAPEGNDGGLDNAGETAGNAESGNDDGAQAEVGKGDTIRLSFVGDILLADSVGELMKRSGFDFPYKESLLYLSEPDLTAGNLEYPVTNAGVPADDKQFVFKGTPEALPHLRDAGFDVVNLANNHTLDQGVDGLFDTMAHLDEAGIGHMGAGKDDTEAFTPLFKEANGIKVAYVGLSRVVPETSWKADKNKPGVAETYDTTRAVAAIKKAKQQADLVVVMVHWGIERADTPEKYQRDFAREYIDAGADLIVGGHPHVLQGFEKYKGKWIAYSLGNFIFSVFPKGKSGETGVLDAVCTAKGDCELQFHPMYADNAQPKPLEGDKAKALLERLTSISFSAKFREDGMLESE